MNNTELLYKPFDIQVHKKNFIHYLEVVIDTEGLYTTQSLPIRNG